MQQAQAMIADHDAVQLLYDRGRYIDAWTAAATMMQGWRGRDRLLLVRMLSQLGAGSQVDVQIARAWREAPNDGDVAAIRLRQLRNLRGPLGLAGWIRSQDAAVRAGGATADWDTERAALLIELRDFAAAAEALDAAQAADPMDPWPVCVRADLHGADGRREEAAALLGDLLSRRGDYRPAVQRLAQLHAELGRPDDGVALLRSAQDAMQSAAVCWQLAVALHARRDHAGALAVLAGYESLVPLLSAERKRGVCGLRSDLLYALGDISGAIAEAERSQGWHRDLAQRLRSTPSGAVRRELAVPVVRQDHMTCAPATLVSICLFHGVAADQRAVAERICYDGTPDFRERLWAGEAGFTAIEFTVTWEATKRLIDAGLPFTLTTRGPGWAHLQAVVGYDSARGTLLLRDPGTPYPSEAAAEGLLADNRAWGPRGMAMLPALADPAPWQDLPDAALWDRLHALRLAIDARDDAAAAASEHALALAAPDHPLRWRAQRELALSRNDGPARIAADARLAAMHPADPTLFQMRLSDLSAHGTRTERLALIAEARQANHDFAADRAQAFELAVDAAGDVAALPMLRRVLRYRSADAGSWRVAARIASRQGRSDDAVDAWRAAATCEPLTEDFAEGYAEALAKAGRSDAAEAWLRARCAGIGARSAQPHLTLARMLGRWSRDHEAEAHLETACAMQGMPVAESSGLVMDLARRRAWRDPAAARTLLEQARPGMPRTEWLAGAAQIAEAAQRPHEALGHWEEVAAVAADHIPAQHALLRLRERCEGGDAALRGAERAASRFPWNDALSGVRLQAARRYGTPARWLALASEHRSRFGDAWAWREEGFAAIAAGDMMVADEAARRSREMAPADIATWNLSGDAAHAAGDPAAAEEHWLRAIALSADAGYAIGRLAATAHDAPTSQRRLRAIAVHLRDQVTDGDGLWEWYDHALRWLPHEEVAGIIDAAWSARPDLWSVWSLRARDLLRRDDRTAARACIDEALARHPLLPRLHADKARVLMACAQPEEAIKALREALRLAPGWGWCERELSVALRDAGRHREALSLLEAAAQRDPGDAVTLAHVGSLRLLTGDRDGGLTMLERACRIDPAWDWPWERIEAEDPARALDTAREATTCSPGSADAWRRWAGGLRSHGRMAEAEDACRHALALPHGREATRCLLARILSDTGRVDDAFAVLREVEGAEVPRLQAIEAYRLHLAHGLREAAIADLDRMLAANPDDLDVRCWRCELRSEAGHHGDAVDDAKELATRHPGEAMAHAYRGDALAAAGRSAEAIAALETAIRLRPGYGYALRRRIAIALDQRDPATAREQLALLRRCEAGPLVHGCALRIALANKGKADQAEEDLHALATMPGPHAAEELRLVVARGRLPTWRKTLERALSEDQAQPIVGEVLAQWWAADDAHGTVIRTILGIRDQDTWRSAVSAAIGESVRHRGWSLGRRLVAAARDRIAADTFLWGRIGWMHNADGRHGDVVSWLADWRTRSQVEPWMLINLASALHQLRRHAEGDAVVAHALGLPGGHQETLLRAWGDWAAARRGDALPEGIPPVGKLDRREHQEVSWLPELSELLRTPGFARAMDRIARLRGLIGHREEASCLKPYLVETARTLARREGGTWARIRAWWATT